MVFDLGTPQCVTKGKARVSAAVPRGSPRASDAKYFSVHDAKAGLTSLCAKIYAERLSLVCLLFRIHFV
jgi:hypothetical protein